jgi:uncharacterized protein YndB with AHSA1/START domain
MQNNQFVYVTYIKTTPEKLWAALTQSEFTTQYWFASSIESDWKVGSPVNFRHDGRLITDNQTVLKYEPHRLLSYSWHNTHDEELRKERPSRVTFEIEPRGEKPGVPIKEVKLTVTHDGFPADSKVLPRISNGWPAVLSSLKSLLENGTALEMDSPCGASGAKPQ